MKVIFLDIDEVLNSIRYRIALHRDGKDPPFAEEFPSRLSLDPRACQRLDEAVVATGAKLVISSTWRKIASPVRIEELLRLRGCIHADVLGATDEEPGTRGDQIDRWLRQHPEVSTFAILDDDSDMGKHLCRLIKTCRACGFQDEDRDGLIALLCMEGM